MGRGLVGDIQGDADAQAVQYVEELAPLHRFAAPLDLAEKVLADADASRRGVA